MGESFIPLDESSRHLADSARLYDSQAYAATLAGTHVRRRASRAPLMALSRGPASASAMCVNWAAPLQACNLARGCDTHVCGDLIMCMEL